MISVDVFLIACLMVILALMGSLICGAIQEWRELGYCVEGVFFIIYLLTIFALLAAATYEVIQDWGELKDC